MADRAVALVEARFSATKGAPAAWERTGLATLLADIPLAEGRFAAAWAVARARGLPDHALRRLAEASEGTMPEEALTAFAGFIELQITLTSRQGYEEACRLIARMGALRARRGDEAGHRAFVSDLFQRHDAKRSFVVLLREATQAISVDKPGRPAGASRKAKPRA